MRINKPLTFATWLVYIAASLLLTQADPEPMDIDEPDADLRNDLDHHMVDADNVDSSIPKVFDYGEYVDEFRKAYSPVETVNKARLFYGRTLQIFKHNLLYKQKEVTYFLKQNQFTDMTAREIKRSQLEEDMDLLPVNEALKYPDLPANLLWSVRKYLEGEEGYSESSLKSLDNFEEVRVKSKQVRPMANFLEDEDVESMNSVLNEVKTKPEVAAKIANLVDLSNNREDSMIESDKKVAKKIRRIKYKPIVDSNNKNYDFETLPSHGFGTNTMSTMTENYAKYLMSDPGIEFELRPYPLGKSANQAKGEVDDDETTVMSSLISSVKGIIDFFSLNDDDDEDDNEHETTDGSKRQSTLAAGEGKKKIDSRKASTGIKKIKTRYTIDWRKTGCLTEPKDQMNCNACYAFTTLALMEYFYCRQKRELTDFSAQYVVDCGSKEGLKGCKSGQLLNTGHFIRSHGIELDATYPYSGKEAACPYSSSTKDGLKRTGYLRPEITHWQQFHEMADWYRFLRRSPLLVGINIPLDFMGYGGDIHSGANCAPGAVHAMLLVGSGVENGQEFWLMRNSYSPKWGENGYFKLSKAAPARCFKSAIVVRANFLVSFS